MPFYAFINAYKCLFAFLYIVCPIAHNKHVHKQSLHTTHVHVHVLLDYIVPVILIIIMHCTVIVISNCIFTSNIKST